eukprot:TRINITY_DN630_c0_g2_i1.p1 TRINITY_DN630_c0_g2~~TRINITY_DN630_c0_g2_i1.p1  ORF type:complete len:383 (-),score=70.10 TRINITY_DN630_c0_g2_i1:48-1196(-)
MASASTTSRPRLRPEDSFVAPQTLPVDSYSGHSSRSTDVSSGGQNNEINAIANPVGWTGLFGFIGTLLRVGYSFVAWALPGWNEDQDPVTISLEFQRRFEEQYGTSHPRFFAGSFSQAVQQSKRECKLLLVYLHSELHVNTPTFCREMICSELFTEFTNENFVLWAASIASPEGYKVSNVLDVSTYPFLGLLSMDANTLLCGFEGATDVTTVVDKLTNVLEAETANLTNYRVQQEERERDRLIREEQEMAYQLALEADREKERQAQEEEQRLKEMERMAKEAEENKKRAIEFKKRNLPPEPAQGQGVQLVVRMPNGSRLSRRFNPTDLVQSVYDYVDSHQEEIESDSYELVMSYPRKVFSDKTLKLQDVDASKQILLLVSLK